MTLRFIYDLIEAGFSQPIFDGSNTNILPTVAGSVICVLLFAGGFLYDYKKYEFNIFKTLLVGEAALITISGIYGALYNKEGVFWLIIIIASAMGITFIVSDIQQLKLFPINLGLLILFAQIIMILQNLEIDPLLFGILFIVFGGIMIFINKLISDKKRKVLVTGFYVDGVPIEDWLAVHDE